ncbi:hypothetical protein EGI26_03125 [Lacihabitans sp. CCS-44]|uniref:hypothetical protein n=1 Tax=Lacihabitans sp. CCS-44 TaxID=2487331 RepID=UPI0020CEA254|nr:hypothetical protein [Lacihabitans sp. CCS-44]MCP9754155.1 hypothetical protein [Lacihabitans sp. CCS-44]
MKAVLAVFQRAIVWDYYRKNVLFLLVVILFAFGFLSGQEHQTIAKQALNSPKLLIYTGLLWVFYGLKTYLFVLRSLSQPEFRFLFDLKLLNVWKRIFVWFYVSFMLNQLTFLYAVFMVLLGLMLGKFLSVVFILTTQLVVILIGVFVYQTRIAQNPETKFSYHLPIPKFFKLRLPALLFYHKYLVFKEPVLLLSSKVFSVFFLLFFIWLFPTDDYDYRLFSISAIIISVSHLRICSQYVYFQNSNLLTFRNLPLGLWFKITMLICGYLIILLPEIYLFIIRGRSLAGFGYIITWIVFLLSSVIFIHCFQYFKTLTDETKMQYFFFGFVLILLSVMYKTPILLLSSIFLLSGFWFFWKYENLYEADK